MVQYFGRSSIGIKVGSTPDIYTKNVITRRASPSHMPMPRIPAYAICSSDALVLSFAIFFSLFPDSESLQEGPQAREEQEPDDHPLDRLRFRLGENLHAHDGAQHDAHERRHHDH